MKLLLAKLWKFLRFPKNIQLFIMRRFQDVFLIGVTGIIFNEKNEVLVFKHVYRAHSWSLPGGYIKSGEHPLEGVEREILEESGLIVSADELLIIRTDRSSARIDFCCIGLFIGGEFKPTHEVVEYGFYSLENLPLLRKNQLFLIDQALKQRLSK
ncbi:MAG: NUDIX domain-containing protein [Pseudomonadales bacterium]|nr:NUDIX domain-containing protein [Pseudomonadales bacterium]